MPQASGWRAVRGWLSAAREAVLHRRPPPPATSAGLPAGGPGAPRREPDPSARHRALAARHVPLDPRALERLEASLKERYFASCPDGYLDDEAGRNDLLDHLTRRLDNDRRLVVPWLDGILPLRGASVLEIGCGTGSSTVALAEQGAAVTAVDVAPRSVEVARVRAELSGLPVEFHVGNAAELGALFPGRTFDLALFYASLEHMVPGERLRAIRAAWDLLRDGGFLGVVETPNRLWVHDHHTSLLPFFHWLPDEIAFLYSRFSPRGNFRELYRTPDPASLDHFLKRGRGVSFHEFDLALRPVEELQVAGALSRRPLPAGTIEGDYFRILMAAGRPGIHAGFYEPVLDLLIRKG